MRLLLVSDSHGNHANLFKAHALAGPVDAVIHLGDGEPDADLLAAAENTTIIRVAGNCDIGSTAPRELICSFEGVRLLICHGDQYGVKSGLRHLMRRAAAEGVDAALFGHTHQALIEQQNNIWLINPGTLWGRAPFLSYALLDITPDGIKASLQILPE